MFKFEWVPIAHHILLTSESFNWEQNLSMNLNEEIEKYQKNPTTRKSPFHMSGYVMDVFCATSSFPAMGWNWSKTSPLVHIYCSDMWEDNFVPWICEICDLFLGSMYQIIFREDAPTFFERAKDLISLHGDWYVGEYLSYIRILGNNKVHMLPIILPDRLVLQEVAYQTVIDGVFPKLAQSKRKAWPKFPSNMDFSFCKLPPMHLS